MSSYRNYISEKELLHTSYAMIALTSSFVLARVGIQVVRRKMMVAEDYLVMLAYLLFLALTILGATPMYPEIMIDSLFLIKVFFSNTMIFWFVLWTVKFSLLALYRRLTIGLNSMYNKVCMHAWFTPGECATPRDVRAQIASLYYAFAVDVISDLLIMAFPIRLIWNLQVPRAQKFSIVALFCTGVICILFAIIRVVQIGVKANNSSTPSSSWLAFWAVIECAIAVIIGCCPAFAALFRKAHTTTKGSYNAQGYLKHPSSRSGNPRSQDIHMKSMVSSANRTNNGKQDTYWGDASSQEELASKNDGIMVTKTLQQENEPFGVFGR